MEMMKLKITMGKDQMEGVTQNITIHRPKLPKFEEDKDDMDTFLQRFERFAKMQKWKPEEWVVSLSPLLTGKGLEVYTNMPDTDVDNYEQLKMALLKRYQLTEEGFRRRFREGKADKGETVFQFVARLRRYFRRWVELSGVERTYEALEDLLVQEQYITTCGQELAIFLRERVPKDVKEMTRLAEQYIEARDIKDESASKLETEAGGACNQPISSECMNHIPENRSPYRRRQCYICNRSNHVAKDCYYRESYGYTDMHHNDSMSNQNQQERKKHEERNEHHNQQLGLNVTEVNERQSEPTAKQVNKLFVQEGLVNKKKVKVLRDTGCTTAAVNMRLVLDHQFIGEETSCTLIDGTQRRFPLARIHVDTPYYTGKVEAMVMNEPMYELILGNLTAVRKVPDPEWRMEAGAVFLRDRFKQRQTWDRNRKQGHCRKCYVNRNGTTRH